MEKKSEKENNRGMRRKKWIRREATDLGEMDG